jgi:predicted DsbA family dithiol-disulfide isomerase
MGIGGKSYYLERYIASPGWAQDKRRVFMESDKPITIDYFSDVLCVWAWIAQPRLEKLHLDWGEKIQINHRYLEVFGDTANKIPPNWGMEDGYQKFRDHVVESAKPHDEVEINNDIWSVTRPATSMNAHLVLRAVGETAGGDAMAAVAQRIREAFFLEARDVGDIDVLMDIVDAAGVSKTEAGGPLKNGLAMASLASDMHFAGDKGIKGSPTWVLNGGRQILYGNVGYRILHANIEELIRQPVNEASWC